LFTFVYVSDFLNAPFNFPNLDFIQPTRPFLTISCNERNGVIFVQQLDYAFHLNLANLKVLSDPTKVNWENGIHGRQFPLFPRVLIAVGQHDTPPVRLTDPQYRYGRGIQKSNIT
jgi:hypothetical protein